MRPTKGTPTDLNLWVLRRVFGDKTEVPNALEPTDVTHMRRCLKAGLVAVTDRKSLALTDAGVAALNQGDANA